MGALAQPAAAVKVLRLSELIRPNRKQLEFLHAVERHLYVLYGGAAGGGKSFILRWWLLKFLLEAYARHGVRNVRVGLFCEDYNALRDRHISKIKHEFPLEMGEVKASKDEGLVFKLREGLGGGFISLRNLDDPAKYQSVEFAAIAVDELTKNTQDVFEDLRMRLRWPGFPPGFRFPFGAATNPGSTGHGWVKSYWIDCRAPEVLDQAEFAYVKALAADNPYLPADYERTQLATIVDPQKRKAFREGDWNLFAGQFFGEWRVERHVCAPFAIPAWWRRFRASDWGYSAPWATLWFAVSQDGMVYCYRELYERERDAGWMARRINELSEGEAIEYTVLDPGCWDDSRGASIAEQLARAGVGCRKASNDRRGGWSQVRSYLAWDAAKLPRLQVFAACENLIRTLPALPFAAGNSEDLDTDAEDHAADALRYGLMSRPQLTVAPLAEMPREEAEAVLRLSHAGAAPAQFWSGVAN